MAQSSIATTANPSPVLIPSYWDFGARSRYLGHEKVIIIHDILWDVVTYPYPTYLLLALKSSYITVTCIINTFFKCKKYEQFLLVYIMKHHILI